MNNFLIGTLLFFIAGIISIFVRDKIKGLVLVSFGIVAQFFILPEVFSALVYGNLSETIFSFSQPIGNASLRLDPLAAFFALIISVGSLLASIYSYGYMKHYQSGKYSLSSFYFFFGLLITAMLLVVTVQNSIMFLVVWELMSISSFFLVSFENDKEDVRKAGIYYLIAMQIGASFLIAAFAWIASLTGSFDFASFTKILGGKDWISILLFIMFFIGFGTKAGFVPFHTWLPRAHPAAPTGVSAIMSGVMIKTGIYGILRILLLVGVPDSRLAFAVLFLSIITGILGVMNAIAQHDLKKLLAYHSIENIGIIGMGIGIGMVGLAYNQPTIAFLGFLGGILHVFNHFVFKSLLFYGVGVVYLKAGTRNTEKLGGLIKFIPITASLFLLGSIAISGLPLFNGFISEFALYLGMAKGFSINNLALNIAVLIGMSGLALIGAMAVLCFTKVVGICFLGLPRKVYDERVSEKSFSFLMPMITLSLFILFIGLLPGFVLPTLYQVLKQFIPADFNLEFANIINIYNWLSQALFLLGGMILFFLLLRFLLLRKRQVTVFKTWDCGYQAESSRLQYTSSSFASPFLELIAEFVPRQIKVETQKNYFPAEAHLETTHHDFTEKSFIQPILKIIRQSLNSFAWIQSGQMQQYILYGLIFLILILIWIIGGM
ncbi:MAG: proton-conducting transporter membrane subunit [Ignavibacteriales bacterium]|nr:proton-conducting transporter membrane subunit [Ignavibacteriales bacterium]